jgi:hypothetical protein
MDIDNYSNSILQQRAVREKSLLASPHNWFSLIGLFPLAEGNNSLGVALEGSVSIAGLPGGFSAVFRLNHGKVSLGEFTSGLLVNGDPAKARVLGTDRDEVTDVLAIGNIHIIVIQRGERFFLRAWDLNAPAARDFSGLRYFPVDPTFRITAQFITFPQPQILQVEDMIGTRYESKFIGRATFNLYGETCSLIAEEDDEALLFSFTDLTKTDATYPGGRFFTTPLPENGKVVLDFNLANNWPCAYTSYATCPLPPSENHLKVRIEAGEKRYSPDH